MLLRRFAGGIPISIDADRASAEHHGTMKPYFPPRGSSALRRGRVSIESQWYLLTFCCHERNRYFLDPRCARPAVAVLSSDSLWRASMLSAWVLMPDHFHALVQLHSESLSRLVNRVKSVSSAAVRREVELPAAIWMRGFHDRALRVEDGLEQVEEYILLNPVRAGLGDDYPWRSKRISA